MLGERCMNVVKMFPATVFYRNHAVECQVSVAITEETATDLDWLDDITRARLSHGDVALVQISVRATWAGSVGEAERRECLISLDYFDADISDILHGAGLLNEALTALEEDIAADVTRYKELVKKA